MPTRTSHLPGLLSGIWPQQAVPGVPPSWRMPTPLIGTLSWEALGEDLLGISGATFASATHPAANRGIGFPFEIGDPYFVQKVWWMNGTTASTDTVDVAVYTEAGGASSRLVAGGGAVASGASTIQAIDSTDVLLMPGRYWCVHAQSGVTATTVASVPAIALVRACGVAQMASAASAGVLGTTWTPAAAASAYIPLFGIAGRPQVG